MTNGRKARAQRAHTTATPAFIPTPAELIEVADDYAEGFIAAVAQDHDDSSVFHARMVALHSATGRWLDEHPSAE